jgi:hypothetical protein
MAKRMLKENMSDLDAAELKVAAGIFEKALQTIEAFGREIERLKRQVAIFTSVEDPLPGLRVKDAGAFFDEEVCEKVLTEIFSNPVKLSDMPAAQKFRSPVTPGIAVPETEKAHRGVMGSLGAALMHKTDADMLGPRKIFTTEEGMASEQALKDRSLELRVRALELSVHGWSKDG